MYDIIAMIWFLRRFHCKFVSKKELGKVFQVFLLICHGGSALIDRKDPKQAIPAIKGLGEYIESITVLQLFFQKEPEVKQGSQKHLHKPVYCVRAHHRHM
jgi:1-acyl-sn-glycerol-3-phosphate acyltransferase